MRTRLLVSHSVLSVGLLCCIPVIHAEDLLIQAAKVYTMTGEPLTPGAVLISNGKIVKVDSKLAKPADAKLVDLGDGILMPGLIDAYSNAGIAANASEITKEITPDFRVLSAIDWRSRAFRAQAADGTTTVGLAPGADCVVAGLACAVKTAGERRVIQPETGLLITMSSDPASGNSARQRPDSIYVRQPTNRMGVVWMLRSTFDHAARQKSPGLATVAEALAGKRRMFAVSRTEYDLLSLLRLAREFKFTPTIVGGQEAYRIREELTAAKTPIILGPLSTSSSLNGPEGSEVVWNAPGLLYKSGIPFALSGGQLLDQARFAVRYGLPADAALDAVTRTPARLLGIESRVGTIAQGRDADFIALDGDPLEATTSIQWTMVDGKISAKGN